MPTCKCGKTIQSGQLCKQCALDEYYSGVSADSDSSTSNDDEPLLYECTACGERYWRERGDDCPACGSGRRRYVGPVEDAGHPVPTVRSEQGAVTVVHGPDPETYQRVERT